LSSPEAPLQNGAYTLQKEHGEGTGTEEAPQRVSCHSRQACERHVPGASPGAHQSARRATRRRSCSPRAAGWTAESRLCSSAAGCARSAPVSARRPVQRRVGARVGACSGARAPAGAIQVAVVVEQGAERHPGDGVPDLQLRRCQCGARSPQQGKTAAAGACCEQRGQLRGPRSGRVGRCAGRRRTEHRKKRTTVHLPPFILLGLGPASPPPLILALRQPIQPIYCDGPAPLRQAALVVRLGNHWRLAQSVRLTLGGAGGLCSVTGPFSKGSC